MPSRTRLGGVSLKPAHQSWGANDRIDDLSESHLVPSDQRTLVPFRVDNLSTVLTMSIRLGFVSSFNTNT